MHGRIGSRFLLLPFILQWFPVSSIPWDRTPEPSSTLLQLHRLYLQQPPHDRTLYDRLNVSPNATAAAIRKNYRELSRKYHPDKQRDPSAKQATRAQLELVRQAYEVLKDDRSRLPYHRYGLLDIRQAVILLTGQNHQGVDDPSIQALLQLMGYPIVKRNPAETNVLGGDDSRRDSFYSQHTPEHSIATSKHDRMWLVATNLVERMRPYVEGRISAQCLADVVAQQCDSLKHLPLGASILRCVGRAYRYEANRYLRAQRLYWSGSSGSGSSAQRIVSGMTETVRFHWRHAKHLATAAVASGRCVLVEQQHKLGTQRKQKSAAQAVMYQYADGELGQLVDEETLASDEDMRLEEKLKAQRVMIESLQIEALWKLSKMELDEIIREACQMILRGESFFYPTRQTLHFDSSAARHPPSDGWVGSAGMAIDANIGRLRAAQALQIMGEVMVSRSKEGTAWMQ